MPELMLRVASRAASDVGVQRRASSGIVPRARPAALTGGSGPSGLDAHKRMTFAAFAVVGCLFFGVACSKSHSSAASGVTTASVAVASTGAPSVTAAAPSSTAAPRVTKATTTTFPKVIRVGNITFHVPQSWDVDGGPPRAYVGVLAGGRGDVTLRVETSFSGTIDSLAPTTCLGAPPSAPARVDLVDQGFRPVGDRTAEFRFWRSSCPDGDVKVEEHRAWLLPTSHIAIFEQRHESEVEEVVATAMVG